MLNFDIITLFPEAFNFQYSIVGRALETDKVKINIHNLRNYGEGPRRNVDDKPFGGGPGMVMAVEPIYKCLVDIGAYPKNNSQQKILVTAANGTQLSQSKLTTYQQLERIIIICGHYEGIDQRVIDYLADESVSIGNYVLSGGEVPAQVIVDGVTRLIPGVLGNPESLTEESHSEELNVEYPQYTRPAEFVTAEGDKWGIPEILLSGHHAQIEKWRKQFNKNINN